MYRSSRFATFEPFFGCFGSQLFGPYGSQAVLLIVPFLEVRKFLDRFLAVVVRNFLDLPVHSVLGLAVQILFYICCSQAVLLIVPFLQVRKFLDRFLAVVVRNFLDLPVHGVLGLALQILFYICCSQVVLRIVPFLQVCNI